jgi:Mrp family chromosome partitioning ATPase
LRTLTNLISLEDLPKPTVIALTAGHGTWGSRNIAAELAELSARRHERAVLVYADNEPAQSRGEAGFNEALADPSRIPDLLRDGDIPSLKVLAVGAHLADRYPLATRERILAVLDELRSHGDIVFVAAPAISDGSDASLLCAAADAAILVVAAGSRAGDISAAAEALERAHAAVLGAVLIDATQTSTHSEAVDRSDVIESGLRPAHDHRSPVHTADTRPHSWSVPEQDHA